MTRKRDTNSMYFTTELELRVIGTKGIVGVPLGVLPPWLVRAVAKRACVLPRDRAMYATPFPYSPMPSDRMRDVRPVSHDQL